MTKKTIALITAISLSTPLMLSANNINKNNNNIVKEKINKQIVKKKKTLTPKDQENYLLACWPRCRPTDVPKISKEKNIKAKKIRI